MPFPKSKEAMKNFWKRFTDLFKPRDPWVKVDNTDLNNKLKDALDATPDLRLLKELAIKIQEEGAQAYRDGKGISDNPYVAGFSEPFDKAYKWHLGYDVAMLKSKLRKDKLNASLKDQEPIVYHSTEGTSSDEAHYLRKAEEEEKALAKAKREIEMDVTYAIADKIGEWYPTSTPFDLEKHHRMARAILKIIDRSKYGK